MRIKLSHHVVIEAEPGKGRTLLADIRKWAEENPFQGPYALQETYDFIKNTKRGQGRIYDQTETVPDGVEARFQLASDAIMFKLVWYKS